MHMMLICARSYFIEASESSIGRLTVSLDCRALVAVSISVQIRQ